MLVTNPTNTIQRMSAGAKVGSKFPVSLQSNRHRMINPGAWGKDQNVINICNDKLCHHEGSDQLHQPLKNERGIIKPERHDNNPWGVEKAGALGSVMDRKVNHAFNLLSSHPH